MIDPVQISQICDGNSSIGQPLSRIWETVIVSDLDQILQIRDGQFVMEHKMFF